MMNKYSYIILILVLSILSCKETNKVKNQLIGNSFYCTNESIKKESNEDFYLEFVNDSILIHTFYDNESNEYVQLDRWNIESNIFGTKLVLTSILDIVKCKVSESKEGISFRYKKNGEMIIGTKIQTRIIDTKDIIGVWENKYDSFPPNPNNPNNQYIHPTYTFNSDNTFELLRFSNKRKGSWNHNEASNHILLNGGNNSEDIIKIINLDSNHIIISYRDRTGEMEKVKLIKNRHNNR